MRLLARAGSILLAILLVGCGGGDTLGTTPEEEQAEREAFAADRDGCAGIPHGAVAARQVYGGDGGAFVREMTGAGYRSISAHLVPPDYQTSSADEQPWVYFGLGDGTADVEAGLAFQRGDATLLRRWRPYLRRGGKFVYGDRTIAPGNRIFMKAYYTAGGVHLQIDGQIAGSIAVTIDTARIHARRVVAIATPFSFNGSNLKTAGLHGVVFEDTQVVHVNGTVASLRDLHRYFWQASSASYGSVCWPGSAASYLRDASLDRISLF